MIGNDIIDLQAAATESNPLRRGFIEKIFNSYEQKYIEDSKERILQIWIFWAMKEAAYKAHQRRFNLPRQINPKQMECKIITKSPTSASGVINIQQYAYYSTIIINNKYIHATASAFAQEEIFSGIFPMSANLKRELINKISTLKDIPYKLLSITKNENQIPFLCIGDNHLDTHFSLSHHGFFSAFCLPLTNY